MNRTDEIEDWNTGIYGQAAMEDRCAPRQRVSIPASLRPSGSSAFSTVVHDLALGGFCANALRRMHPGNCCWLTLPGMAALQAEVVWWDSGRVGCAFTTLLSPVMHDHILQRHRLPGMMRSV